jgi:hypothetical protein
MKTKNPYKDNEIKLFTYEHLMQHDNKNKINFRIPRTIKPSTATLPINFIPFPFQLQQKYLKVPTTLYVLCKTHFGT